MCEFAARQITKKCEENQPSAKESIFASKSKLARKIKLMSRKTILRR